METPDRSRDTDAAHVIAQNAMLSPDQFVAGSRFRVQGSGFRFNVLAAQPRTVNFEP
jgi:hypothetical protein